MIFGNRKKIEYSEETKLLIKVFCNNFEKVTLVLEGFVASCYTPTQQANPAYKLKYLQKLCGELKIEIQAIFDSMDETVKSSSYNTELTNIRNGLTDIMNSEYNAKNSVLFGQNVRKIWTLMQNSKNDLFKKLN